MCIKVDNCEFPSKRCGPVQDAREVVLPADLVARQVKSFGS